MIQLSPTGKDIQVACIWYSDFYSVQWSLVFDTATFLRLCPRGWHPKSPWIPTRPLFSAFNPRSPSRTRPPITTFLSPVISSSGINSRSLSRSAVWTSSRMIHKAILSWLICNTTERLRVWLPLSPMATHWILLMLALPLMPLWWTNRTQKSLEILTPFMLTLLWFCISPCYYHSQNVVKCRNPLLCWKYCSSRSSWLYDCVSGVLTIIYGSSSSAQSFIL